MMKIPVLLAWFVVLVCCGDFDGINGLEFEDFGSLDSGVGGYDDRSMFSDNSTGLQEFVPIRNTILQSETQYYSFSVNTSGGLGSFYQSLIFLTGNICAQPQNVVANQTSIAVYYSFNSSMFSNFEIGKMSLFENGYFQALAEVPVKNDTGINSSGDDSNPESDFSILYIAVRAPQNTNRTAQWSYQIGVSQNDLVFQWDDRSWAQVLDTDDNSALIVTGNLTNSGDYLELNATDSNYLLYVYSYDYKDYFSLLNSSWCAIRNGPALLGPVTIETLYTRRLGSLQQQFYVQGLNALTTYIGYLLSDFKGEQYGGAVYQPFEFETMADDACQLIFDLEFCAQVSYSVPVSSHGHTKQELAKLYDDQAARLYGNFSKAMQQVACNTTDTSEYSPMRTCEDCDQSYVDWLCSVTIPRCTTRNQTGYLYRDLNESRNDFINQVVEPPKPYYEVLPCIATCNDIVRDCPPQFGFVCPTSNDSIALSYYWWLSEEKWPSCNRFGHRTTTSGSVRARLNYVVLCLTIFATLHIL